MSQNHLEYLYLNAFDLLKNLTHLSMRYNMLAQVN